MESLVPESPQKESDSAGLKLSDLVYFKIAARIRSSEYPLNSRLPTENDLADELGVSRPVVREALARLRTDGLVVSRRGSGTYVKTAQELPPARLPPLTSIADMRRCLEYRISVEGEAAWHAAIGVAVDRAPLVAAAAVLEQDCANRVLEPEHDFAFHYAVAQATGNRFFAETLLNMQPTIRMAMSITPNFIPLQSGNRLALLNDEHRAIHDAILADDPEAARAAMRHHLTSAMNRVFEGL